MTAKLWDMDEILAFNEYWPDQIIKGAHIEIFVYQSSAELNIYLEHYHPTTIIVMDPQLEILRTIEVYNSWRTKFIIDPKDVKPEDVPKIEYFFERKLEKTHQINLHLIYFKDSTEKFKHIDRINWEKLSFNNLIKFHSKIYISLPDYKNLQEFD